MLEVDASRRSARSSLILSVRAQFVQAISAGSKTVEFRRRLGLSTGSLVYLYSTAPDSAIVGSFIAGRTFEASPGELWERFKHSAGITREQLFEYLAGRSVGYAIGIEGFVRWNRAISLGQIRRLDPGFAPPQFFRRVSSSRPLATLLAACHFDSRNP